jgi:hypothetical protein
MNNCGFNVIHTDMIGNSWEYPEADYDRRAQIWQEHISYTKGFLWFMSSDESVPDHVRDSYRNEWGFCGDEFSETDHFSPQLYVREARRLVGDHVFSQSDVLDGKPLEDSSIGMGCYGFDSHCEERYACTDTSECTLYDRPYVAVQCGTDAPNPDVYQLPLSLIMPKRSEVSNLLVSVCVSASHVAYATVRMEPQYMIMGHAAGAVAAISILDSTERVQNVDADHVRKALLKDGQIVSPKHGNVKMEKEFSML